MKRKIRKRRPQKQSKRNRKWRRTKVTIKPLFSIDLKQEKRSEYFNSVYLAYNYSTEGKAIYPLSINFVIVDC
jgi:hypothetical protein